jgi:RHS repeat-associated protein
MPRSSAALLVLITLAVAQTATSPAGASKPHAGADLSVVTLGDPPARVDAGASLRISYAVRNAGSRRARASAIGFSLSLDTRRDAADVPLGTASVAALRGRRSSRGNAKLRVPEYVPGGTYRVLACADLAGKVRERNERNNCRVARASVAVTGRPGGPSGPPVRPEPGNGELPPPPTGPGTGSGGPAGPDPIPPDPAAIAPALPKATAVSTFDAASFLWSASTPVQRGVAPGTIDRDQVLVLRGRVLDRAGVPIEGVRVTVLDHPELGRTQTRADGRYDLAVNGTGLTLVFEAAGFLTTQRALELAWETYDRVEDVVMVPLDGAVTRIAKDSDEPFQVALGTPTTDADGTRRALLLFPKDLTATMALPDGSHQELGDMNVRITEFTAGDQGVEAMPGSLPGTSGYTYAAEFSVDEALEARATQVAFDKPVINYVQNFIDAPVGSDVPTGAYDRENAEWEPGNDGRVVKIASESDGKAVLEGADGLGIGDDELRVLADRYEPGQQLWRVPMRHFTPWDHNWPYGPPRGAQPPKLKEFVWQDPNDPCRAKGSVIGCETGTLGESLPVAGTPYALSYSSDRQPGWSVDDALDVPITGATLPDRLKGIELKVTVAGRDIVQRWCDPSYPTTGTQTCAGMPNISPNITHRVTWDGLDAYGRRPQGRQTVTIRLIYVYEFQYYASENSFDQSFASFPSDLEVFDGRYSCGSISRSIEAHFFCGVPIGQTVTRSIGSWDAKAADRLGGWSLSGHHTYDPGNGVVHLGDGTDRSAQAIGAMTRTIVGGSGPGIGTPEAEGQPVTKVSMSSNITGNTRAPDGTTYFAVWGREHGIFRVGADGKVKRYAGKRSTATDPLAKRLEEEGPPTGDGGPAVDAVLGGNPIAMSVGPDGSLYFVVTPGGATYPRGLIRKITPGGTISTVAGSLDASVGYQDGVPGPQTAVTDPQAVLAASDGSLYWTERPQTTNSMKGRLRRLSASGLVETVAGGGTDNLPADDQDLGDGEPARDNDFGGVPYGLAMGPDGSLYFALPSEHIVERVAPDGRIHRIAGNRTDPVGPPVYGEQAVASSIGNPTGVATGPNGEVYIRHDEPGSPSAVFVSRVRPDGVLEHVAGLPRGLCGGLSQDGEQATRTCIEALQGRGLMVDPDGAVIYQDGTAQLRRIEPALPGFGSSSSAVPSEDGSEVWEFDAAGRHLRTVDGITGAKLQRFSYDGAGRLTGIEDRDGNTTTIERAADGTPQAIVAPGGQRTTLELDGAGRVAAVRDPAGRATTMTYHDGDLLATLKRPEGGTSALTYDARGRLTKDVDPDGVVTTLDRTQADGKTTVDVSVGGRVTSYGVQTLSNGDRVRTIRRPGGAETKLVVRPDSTRVRTDPDGTTTTVEPTADPRWGNLVAVPGKETVRTPAGKERARTWDRTVSLTDPLNRFSVTSMSVAVTENPGGRTEWSYSAGLLSNPDDQTMTVRSPEGRTTTTTLDRLTRPTKIVPAAGVTPIVLAYDARGRVTSATQGSSATTLAYDDQNRLVQRSDGEGGTLGYAYDAADRVTQVRVPGGTYGIAYAADGSRTITTPAGRTFGIGVTPAGRKRSFRPAGQAGGHVRSYGPARELVETALPSGAKRALGYDDAGRLAADNDPQAQRSYGYDGAADVFATLGWQRPGGGGAQSLAFGHDGLLPTSEASSGAATGTVTTAWGAGFLPTQQVIDAAGGTVTTPLAFDRDRMLKQLGAFAIERAGPGGAQSAVRYAGDGLAVTTTRDSLARLTAKRLAVGGAERFAETLAYDNAGRVRSTAMAGATRFYEYDLRGQLRKVHAGSATGQVVEEYSYDTDGNRTGAAYDGGASEAATYGPESGRLTKRAGLDYTFDADGFLTKRGPDTFAYSRGGDLLSATVGGKTVTYDYDALGRRTARHEGAATERYLHGDPENPLRITAWIDAGGTLNVPRYDGDGTLFEIDRGGSRAYVATDHLGSPRQITDAAGTTLRTIEYDAFGRVTGGTGSFDLPIGYAGGLSDPVTGLVRFGKRDYEPESGRWTAEDPTFFEGSPGNLYAYVGSNPTTLTDPTGLVCVGFSAYEGLGGGLQFCRDNSIDNADWSLCAELGVGLGGGWDVDLAGGAQETGGAIVAEATWKAGIGGGTLGGELDLDCLSFKSSAKAQYGPAAVGMDSTGGVSVGYASPEEHIGGQAQGKIAYKRCAKW